MRFVVLIYRRGKEEAKRGNRAGSLFIGALTFANVPCASRIAVKVKRAIYFSELVGEWFAGGSGRGEARTRMVLVTRRPERGWFQGILPSNRHLFDW